jgi:hypothetical protein
MKTLAELRLGVRRLLAEVRVPLETISGTASATAAASTVTGTSTLFMDEFNVGNEIRLDSEIREITAIASDTSLTVNRAWTATHTSATIYRVVRQWTDEFLLECIRKAQREVQDAAWNMAPKALLQYPAFLANITAGTDIYELSANMLQITQLQVKDTSSYEYRNVPEVTIWDKNRSNSPWYVFSSATPKPTGNPTQYAVVGWGVESDGARNVTIEFDLKPVTSVTSGIRVYGPTTANALAADTDRSNMPLELDDVIEVFAADYATQTDETVATARVLELRQRGEGRLQRALGMYASGSGMNSRAVRIVTD